MSALTWNPTPISTQARALGKNDIHVWHVRLSEVPQDDILTEEENSHAARLQGELLQKRFLASRRARRLLLGMYTEQAPQSLIFTVDMHGKPSLAAMPHVSFNLSHSLDEFLLTVGTGIPLGIDIEVTTAQAPLEAAAAVFSPQEQEILNATPEAERHALFYRIWTQKEALLKGLGKGFSADPHTISTFEKPPVMGWHINSLDGLNTAAAALAYPLERANILCFCYTPS